MPSKDIEDALERVTQNLRVLTDTVVKDFGILDSEIKRTVGGINARLDRLTEEVEQLRAAVSIGDDESMSDGISEGNKGH